MADSPRWFKSSYSDNGGDCIEVAANLITTRGVVPVRDSKNPHGPALAIAPSAWSSFVSAAKTGEFGAV
ncbi:toxin-antitoxin system, toxin component [Streptomyces natalensis ATCC 27448]|uniref:Toxin-antitoxin system, toxin component n=1 Tax=Streptomyces natalensis ATCC 27448 TaxID=1240678 RepID=A0A0D7CT37_9ACTN|nr:toxin-antitoxin system, toxin component [Streptomyces natalensis ATCC 27448]